MSKATEARNSIPHSVNEAQVVEYSRERNVGDKE